MHAPHQDLKKGLQKTSLNSQASLNFFLRLLGAPLFWVTVAITGFSFPVIKGLLATPVKELPALGRLSDFKLRDQDGQELQYSRALQGQILVVNFIFTRCPDVCPLLTKQMAKLQKRFDVSGPMVRLVSISVDPEHDQPAILKSYAENYGAKKHKWLFLTGDLTQIQDVVIRGFKSALDIREDTNMMDVTHSERFVLVDADGYIRAYRPANNDLELNEIVRDVGIIMNTKPVQATSTLIEVPPSQTPPQEG